MERSSSVGQCVTRPCRRRWHCDPGVGGIRFFGGTGPRHSFLYLLLHLPTPLFTLSFSFCEARARNSNVCSIELCSNSFFSTHDLRKGVRQYEKVSNEYKEMNGQKTVLEMEQI